ncbi:hypothetical protein KSP40_PGU006660 [Platanthera guangdongensis]|uniref:Uncharacterized protein n=1 Tax=Platanthera guangdongensis TaxID=2320717 RepID=A0ABR2LVD0_9ASPA
MGAPHAYHGWSTVADGTGGSQPGGAYAARQPAAWAGQPTPHPGMPTGNGAGGPSAAQEGAGADLWRNREAPAAPLRPPGAPLMRELEEMDKVNSHLSVSLEEVTVAREERAEKIKAGGLFCRGWRLVWEWKRWGDLSSTGRLQRAVALGRKKGGRRLFAEAGQQKMKSWRVGEEENT